MKKLLFALIIIFTLSGCSNEENILQEINIDSFTYQIGVDQLEDISFDAVYTEDTQIISLDETMISSEDLDLLNIRGEHSITITYQSVEQTVDVFVYEEDYDLDAIPIYLSLVEAQSTSLSYEEWLDTIKGEDGVGIDSMTIDLNGHLIIAYSNGTSVDLGQIIYDIEIPTGYFIVNFFSIEGFIISSQLVEEGEDALFIDYTPPAGYIFDEWDGNHQNIQANTNIYPSYTVESFNITLNYNNGVDPSISSYVFNQELVLPNPENIGYEFIGWYTEDNTTSQRLYNGDLVNQNLTLYAQYEVLSYSLTFVNPLGFEIEVGQYPYGANTLLPAPNVSSNIVIIEWYTDSTFETVYDGVMPANDVTLYTRYYDFDYTISGNQAYGSAITINGYNSFYEHLIIPEYINGVRVTEIGLEAFEEANFFTLELPSTLERIGESAFMNCDNVREIVIPNSVQDIKPLAFSRMDNLEAITFPDQLTVLPMGVLYRSKKLEAVNLPSDLSVIFDYAFQSTAIETITLPSTVRYIGDGAFSGTPLMTITIPEGVSELRYGVFQFCYDLTEIHLPSTLHTVHDFALGDTLALHTITLPTENTYLDVVDDVLYSEGLVELIHYPSMKTSTTFMINNVTLYIREYAMNNVIYIESITIPDSIIGAKYNNFKNCNNLQQILTYSTTNPAEVASSFGVLYSADYRYLYHYPANKPDTNYDVNFSTEHIEMYAFANTVNLQVVNLNPNLIDIQSFAFYNSSVMGFDFSSSLSYIYADAFNNADNLISVNLPGSVTTIEPNAFRGCDSLASINVQPANIIYDSFDGVLYTEGGYELIAYPSGKTDAVVDIFHTVKVIRTNAFDDNIHIQEINIPATVETIQEYAFNELPNLQAIKIHTRISDTLIDINYFAFRKVPTAIIYFYSEVYQLYYNFLNQSYKFLEPLSVMPG